MSRVEWAIPFALLLSALTFAPQAAGQDIQQILERADKLLEEAKAAYESARSASSVRGFVEAGFKLEEARIKVLVLQEIGSPEQQKIAADRMRAINQLSKLIHDGRVAISGAPPDAAAPKPSSPDPAAPSKTPDAASPEAPKRHPVPDPGKQKAAEKLIKEVYKDPYSKKTQADRRALAKLLLDQVPDTRDDPAALWILCKEAEDQAIQGCDLQLALAAVDAAAAAFDVDEIPMRASAISAAGKVAKLPDEYASIVTASFRLCDDLVAADQYDAADQVMTAAVALARKAGNVALFQSSSARSADLAEAKGLYQGMKGFLGTLAKSPDDPAANLEMGRFLCFVKGNWETGLRFLVKGSDLTLKDLAGKELANPESAHDRVAIADLWRDLAQKEKSPLRRNHLLNHALSLYEDILPQTTGLLRAKVEKILDSDASVRNMEGAGSPASQGLNLLSLLDPKEDTVFGTWKFEKKVLVSSAEREARIQVPYVPPEEYDVVIEVERTQQKEGAIFIGLFAGGRQFNITCDGWEGDVTGLELLDGKSANQNETTLRRRVCELGKIATLVCSVRKDGFAFALNGTRLMNWKGNWGRLMLWDGYKVNRNDTLILGTTGAPFRFHRVSVTEVSGKGTRLRALRDTAPGSPSVRLNSKVTITSAKLMYAGKSSDVTRLLQAALEANPRMPIRIDDNWIEGTGGYAKTLSIEALIDGKPEKENMKEGDVFEFPRIPPEGLSSPGASQKFTVVEAYYGAGLRYVDVTPSVRSKIADLSDSISPSLCGIDPWPGKLKTLVVIFEARGRRYLRSVQEGMTVPLQR